MLNGKTALITGTNRGIGHAILEKFAENKANIFAHARKETPDFIEKINRLSEKYNITITPLYFDLSDTTALKEEIKNKIFKTNQKIDVLVNTAGIAHGGFFQMTPISKIKEVFDINLFAQMEIIQLIMKVMMKNQKGSIINLASVLGIDITAGSCAYGVSKAALIAFTKTLAAEYAKYNIRINAVAPGLIDTDMAKLMEEGAKERLLGQSAMHRLGKPDEVADLVLYLASDRSSFINGQIIRVDGGKA